MLRNRRKGIPPAVPVGTVVILQQKQMRTPEACESGAPEKCGMQGDAREGGTQLRQQLMTLDIGQLEALAQAGGLCCVAKDNVGRLPNGDYMLELLTKCESLVSSSPVAQALLSFRPRDTGHQTSRQIHTVTSDSATSTDSEVGSPDQGNTPVNVCNTDVSPSAGTPCNATTVDPRVESDVLEENLGNYDESALLGTKDNLPPALQEQDADLDVFFDCLDGELQGDSMQDQTLVKAGHSPVLPITEPQVSPEQSATRQPLPSQKEIENAESSRKARSHEWMNDKTQTFLEAELGKIKFIMQNLQSDVNDIKRYINEQQPKLHEINHMKSQITCMQQCVEYAFDKAEASLRDQDLKHTKMLAEQTAALVMLKGEVRNVDMQLNGNQGRIRVEASQSHSTRVCSDITASGIQQRDAEREHTNSCMTVANGSSSTSGCSTVT